MGLIKDRAESSISAEKAAQIAVDHFSQGFNNAESVMLGLAEVLGVE